MSIVIPEEKFSFQKLSSPVTNSQKNEFYTSLGPLRVMYYNLVDMSVSILKSPPKSLALKMRGSQNKVHLRHAPFAPRHKPCSSGLYYYF